MDIKNTLFTLSNAVSCGTVTEARDIAFDILSKYADCKKTSNLTVIGTVKGADSSRKIMLDAHIDEVSMIVTSVSEDGFLTVSKCGGIDLRTLPAQRVTIHGKERVHGVFCSTPPHLSQGETKFENIADFKIDTMLGARACDLISAGDYVTFYSDAKPLLNNRVTGKSFDDRAGVVCLLELAERFSTNPPPFDVVFVLSDGEELGLRGSRTATFDVSPDEAIAIDVSFGNAPDVSPDDCGKLSNGAMIGFSPVLDSGISKKLVRIAQENGIPYQSEVMGRSTGTNSDVISISKSGVKTGLVSIPLRNMHTPAEVIDLDDIKSVCDLIEKYILSGGADL